MEEKEGKRSGKRQGRYIGGEGGKEKEVTDIGTETKGKRHR